MEEVSVDRPIHLNIDYPDKKLDRLTSFFRPVTAIPILIIFGLLAGEPFMWEQEMWGLHWNWGLQNIPAFVVLPTILMILFRQKYPRWWFNWNLNLVRFATRVGTYLALLTDTYPSVDEEQAVNLQIHYPDVPNELNRGLPLIKWFLAIPHYILLFFLNTAGLMVVILAWFSILFSGRYPKSLFNFVVGVFQWNLRVAAYTIFLVTDNYPPFGFSE